MQTHTRRGTRSSVTKSKQFTMDVEGPHTLKKTLFNTNSERRCRRRRPFFSQKIDFNFFKADSTGTRGTGLRYTALLRRYR